VSGFGSHVEELQAFFRTREVKFGSATDLKPFVERLDADADFRDEMASMMRTIIYRERDGLSWPELIELLTAAVGGEEVDQETAPDVRESVRRLMSFVESVFRTRWNPGSASGPAQVAASEVEVHEPELVEAPAAHGMTDLFYRAQMAAHGGVAETVAEQRRAEAAEDVEDVEGPLLISEPPLELGEETEGPPQRTSRFWIGAAVVCALVLAFCAGLTVHQHMLLPLRDPSQPYQQAPPEADVTATQPGAGQPCHRVRCQRPVRSGCRSVG